MIFFFFIFQDDRSPMSSGESGDESSGIESPGPVVVNQQLVSNPPETIVANSSRAHSDEVRNVNMNSVLYPAAALANIPQEVLLSLVQAGHLQVHQEEGKIYFIFICSFFCSFSLFFFIKETSPYFLHTFHMEKNIYVNSVLTINREKNTYSIY